MKLTKFRKYISWNIISVTGYLCTVIAIIFFVMLILAGSQLNMRADLNEYFYDYIFNHIIEPYYIFYKTQLIWICILLACSVFENKYYAHHGKFGLRIFENNEKWYSRLFITGLALNFLPLYMVFVLIVINIMRII